jgi:hypothetical protein
MHRNRLKDSSGDNGPHMAIKRRRVWFGKEVKPGDNARKVMPRKVMTARADAHAAKLAPAIKKLRATGATTLRAIAAELNARQIPTPRGRGQWQAPWRQA